MSSDLVPINEGGLASYERPQVPRISPDFVRPRLPEVGRIRLGVTKTLQRDGKDVTYPAKLDRFRFTSHDRSLIESVAALYGGKVEPWAADEGPQWQVVSDATTIPVVVPRAELAFSQWFENWDGAVCRRRCDGVRDIVRDCPCTCVDRDRECLPTTRLSVMLPSIPGLGVWRVESHGFNAAAEILGTIELAAAYGAALLPANLTLAQRTKRRPDPKNPGKVVTNRFVVPVLSITASLEEMVETAQLAHRQALGILPSAHDRASDRTMKALRAAAFSRWPKSTEEPERTQRLEQLSDMLGRHIDTISADHDLTEGEALRLASMVDALESTPALTREQAAPISPGAPSAAGADSTAPQGSAGVPRPSRGGHDRDGVSGAEVPAEHHTAEVYGEVAPADGTVPEGESRSDTGLPPGAAPTKPAPTRKRHKTAPTGAPKVTEAIQEAQQFRDDRKAQTVVEHAGWLEALPPEAVYNLMTFFQNADNPEAVSESVVRVFARRNAIEHGAEWTPEQIDKLAAETWRKQ
jgi:hypothetical protein